MPIILIRRPLHPIPELVNDTQELLQKVAARAFNFESEMTEISDISFHIEEYPEESVADMNVLYSQVQAHLERVSSIAISLYKEKVSWQRFRFTARKLIRKARGRLFGMDDSIKGLRNAGLQESAIAEEIPELVDLEEFIDAVLDNLDIYLKIVIEKREVLDKANTNLSRQQKILEILIGLGHAVVAKRVAREAS